MQNPASLVPLKNIFLLRTNPPTSPASIAPSQPGPRPRTRSTPMAKVAPEHGYDKTGFRVEWADGEVYEVRLDIARVVVEVPALSPATSAAPWNHLRGGAPPT